MVIVTNFGAVRVVDRVLIAYGVSKKPTKRGLAKYRRMLRRLERDAEGMASFNWIMGRDLTVLR